MGLIVSVLRSAGFGDCTRGGVSSKADSLTVVNIDGPFEPSEESPAVMLTAGPLKTVRIVPAVEVEAGVYEPVKSWVMFGGNYAATSDSRFECACEEILGHGFYGAVAIHDRIEG